MSVEIPEFGRGYRVLGKVAEGGFGAVYRAVQVDLERPVAIKVVRESGDVDVGRFLREGQAVSRLRHPAIVQVYAVDTLPTGQPFLVFEWVDGHDLAASLERGPLSNERVIELFRTLLEGLAHAHGQGVMHRDVKPGNLLLPRDGGVKIADFGLARMHESRERLTRTGVVMGTPTYMSPEQVQGHAIDHRTDLYSAGVVLYELLAGTPPFVEPNPIDVLRQHVGSTPPPLGPRAPGAPAALVELAHALIAKSPADRPESATAALVRLARVEPVPAPRVRWSSRRGASQATIKTAPPGPPRSARGVAVAAGALLALGAVGLGRLWVRAPAPAPRALAIGRPVPRPPDALEVPLGRPLGAGGVVTAAPESGPGDTVGVTVTSPTSAPLLTGLWPGTAYRVEVAEGALRETARASMPVSLRARYDQRATEDSCTLMVHLEAPGRARLRVRAVDTGSGLVAWHKDGLAAQPRFLIRITGLRPFRVYRVDFEPDDPGLYLASTYFRTLADDRAARALAFLKTILADRKLPQTDLGGVSEQVRNLSEVCDERHVPLLLELLHADPPILDLASEEYHIVYASLCHTYQRDCLPELLSLAPRAIASSRDPARDVYKPLGWMQAPEAMGTLVTWPEYHQKADELQLENEDGAFWVMGRAADNCAAALAGSDPERGYQLMSKWASGGSSRPWHRVTIAHFAARSRDPRMVPAVGTLLASETDARVARELVRGLAAMGRDALPRLRDALGSKLPEARAQALQALARWGDAGDAGAAGALLADRDPAVRANALYARFVLSGADFPELAAGLKASPAEATAAAWALGELGDAAHVDALVEALARDTGGRAARALGRLHQPAAAEALLKYLDGGAPPSALAEACWALGELRCKDAGPRLQKLFARTPGDRFLRLRAAEALLRNGARIDARRVPSEELPEFNAMRDAIADPVPHRELIVDAAFPLLSRLVKPYGYRYRVTAWGCWGTGETSRGTGPRGYDGRARPYGPLASLLLAWPGADPDNVRAIPAHCPGQGELHLSCERDHADARPMGFATVRVTDAR